MANLVFNENALANLLESPNGPYGERLLLVAEQITGNYNAAIGGVWQNQSAAALPVAGYEIDRGQYGLEATIGILDPGVFVSDGKGTVSDYMAHKFQFVEPDKFVPKIMVGWDDPL